MAGSDQQRQEPPPQPAVDGNSDDCRDQQGEAAEGWDAAPADLLLSIFRVLRPEDLLACRAVSRRFRALSDAAQESSFVARYSLAGVAQPPPNLLDYARVRAEAFALCHPLHGKDSLAAIAVRYGADPAALRRVNNVISEHALACRAALYVPVPDPAAAAAGKRAAFVHDAASKRRFVVLLGEGEALPPGGGRERARGPELTSAAAVERLAGMMERALGISVPEAKFYLGSNGNDLRRAIEACTNDQRWARVMRKAVRRRLAGAAARR